MKRCTKKITILLTILLIISGFLMNVKADSGFDGGYSSSSSSFDSSSSYDYGSSSYGESSGPASLSEWLYILFYFGIMITIAICIYNEKNNRLSKGSINALEMDKDKFLNDTGIDMIEFKIMAFEKYKNVQIAWMNFNYEELQKHLTNEMFNMYKSQLEVLNIKGQKNIMENIVCLNSKVLNTIVNNDVISINMIMKVSCNDYIVDSNNKIVNGNKGIVTYTYNLTFIKKNVVKETNICPSCGATIDNNATSECPYCHSTIVSENYDIILSKKTVISQYRK